MSGRAPLDVAVLGAGMIGLDLVTRIRRTPSLRCGLVVGRNVRNRGLKEAAEMGCTTAADGITSLLNAPKPFDIVFDASDATSHADHWYHLRPLGNLLVDLTPSRVGRMVVPTLNGDVAAMSGNISMISCGGQASLPILHALAQCYPLQYVEVVTTAASPSVGRATRLNLDEYIETTQDAVRVFTGAGEVKAMVNLSPARPPAPFRVAMSVVTPGATTERVQTLVAAAVAQVRSFVPGFRCTVCTVRDEVISIAVEVAATGDRIPRYAGNIDIINSAAVLVGERYAARRASAGRARGAS